MGEGFDGADAFFRHEFPHLLEQVDAVGTQGLSEVVLEVGFGRPLGESVFVVGEFLYAGPGGVVGGALALEDFEDLVDFAVALEERFAVGHLDQDAARAPDVHTQVVPFLAHQDFG